ncbi:MAG: tetratricopeptide repeat protein [Candidatus Phocaeicola faecipullorum]|nr:tetratricopeptide repeat protein [Candidatus Phocaeicola faecipullorum]
MKRTYLLAVIALLLGVQIAFAQNVKRPDSYNYTRGVEAVQSNNFEEALEYLNKELEENPDNGYALVWIAYVRSYQEEYGRALTAVDKAFKNIPKKDKEYRTFVFLTRAEIYRQLGQGDLAIKDCNSLLKEQPDNFDAYERRAQLYYEQGEYDLSDKDCRKLISLDQGNVVGYMGIGGSANAQRRYDDAIAQFDYVVKLEPEYSSGYSFRAESYFGLKKWDEAIDDVVRALSIDGNDKAFYLMQALADSSRTSLVAKLKVESARQPHNGYWDYCIGIVYERTRAYKKAIEYYSKSQEKDLSPITASRISNCYSEMGLYDMALEQIDIAMSLDSTYYGYIMAKADLLYEIGDVSSAVEHLDRYVSHYPDYYGGYYRRGWYKDNSRDIDGAIEDYTMSIVLSPDFAYAYLGRADMYLLKGDTSAAKADYEKVVELDTIPGGNSCAQYAFWGLGQKEQAVDFMNRIIQSDSSNAGNYYDAACLYSRMGEFDQAMHYIEIALEKGYRRFAHIQQDDDLNPIKEMQRFKELIQEYTQMLETELNAENRESQQYIEKVVEVPFSKEGSLCKVKCTINNLPLHFVFDTGASDVSISSVEATFMMKNDYLKPTDVIGKQNYMTADGNISEGTVINLRNVNFGGLNLDNVRASVVNNQSAPLLLGQSVLNKLGNIEIDNEKRVLRITYKEKVER